MNKKTISLIVFGLCLIVGAIPITVYAANIFTEDFDSLLSGATISTANTNFDYVRIGTSGTPTITAEEAASGEMHMKIGGSPSTSLTGVGIKSSLGGADVITINFRLKLDNANGNFYVLTGNGSTFTGNSTAFADVMLAVRSTDGALQYRDSTSWKSASQSLIINTNYEIHIVGNRSGTTINYGAYSVADGKMDIFVDGVLIKDDVSMVNNQSVTGFKMYQTSDSAYFRVDSITLENTALAPFTPTSITLTALTAHSTNTSIGVIGLLAIVGLGSIPLIWRRLE